MNYRVVDNPDLAGTLHHYPGLPSHFIRPRNVEVWLPPDYDENSPSGYPVLYMHDGQNLFEPQKAYIGVDWGVDETVTALAAQGQIPPAIVVGVWNTPQRLREYLPQQPYCCHLSRHVRRLVRKQYGGMPLADRYLRFLVHELKPFVDRRYRTQPGPASTFVMGSSMGGLVSLYAICEYPRIYAGAGCLSTHWPLPHEPLIRYLKERLPDPRGHRIYLDYGSEADRESYRYRQKRVEHTLRSRGYEPGTSLLSRYYPGEPHSETAWRTRLPVPLRFLLKTNRPQPETAAAAVEGGVLVS